MDSAREIQVKIINMINEITDVSQLSAIHLALQQKTQNVEVAPNRILPWDDAIAEIRESTSFDDLIKEQGEKSISYEQICQLAEGVEWEHDLEEILEMLD